MTNALCLFLPFYLIPSIYKDFPVSGKDKLVEQKSLETYPHKYRPPDLSQRSGLFQK